jgi:hypothetical protein
MTIILKTKERKYFKPNKSWDFSNDRKRTILLMLCRLPFEAILEEKERKNVNFEAKL